MNRRQLLQLGAAIAGGNLLALSASRSSAGADLRKLFGNPELLARVGHACPDLMAADDDALLSTAGLAQSEPTINELAATFGRRRADDFLAGRIRTIDGWVMAESECALCSLIARA